MKKIIVALQVIRAVRIAMILAVVAAVFASCKKETTDEPTPTAIEKKLIETRNIDDATEYWKYSFDAQQRLIRTEVKNYFYDFEYQAGKMIITTLTKSNNAISHVEEFLLDGYGKTTQKIRKNSSGIVLNNMYLTYDAEGYLINVKTIYPNGDETELKLTISGGNIVEEREYENGLLDATIKYYYDPAAKNYNNNSMAILTWGIKGLFGKESKNVCNGSKMTNAAGELISEFTAVAVLDADGYQAKMFYSYPMTGQKRDFEYFYNK